MSDLKSKNPEKLRGAAVGNMVVEFYKKKFGHIRVNHSALSRDVNAVTGAGIHSPTIRRMIKIDGKIKQDNAECFAKYLSIDVDSIDVWRDDEEGCKLEDARTASEIKKAKKQECRDLQLNFLMGKVV